MSGEDHLFFEWAVQYDGGITTCDDQDQALSWQMYLPRPNWVVFRRVTRGDWLRPGESS